MKFSISDEVKIKSANPKEEKIFKIYGIDSEKRSDKVIIYNAHRADSFEEFEGKEITYNLKEHQIEYTRSHKLGMLYVP